MKFLGTRLGLRWRPPWGERACPRPQAEFARASGRGLRQVKKCIVAPCNTLQGVSDPQGSCNSNRSLCARSWIQDTKGRCKKKSARYTLFVIFLACPRKATQSLRQVIPG